MAVNPISCDAAVAAVAAVAGGEHAAGDGDHGAGERDDAVAAEPAKAAVAADVEVGRSGTTSRGTVAAVAAVPAGSGGERARAEGRHGVVLGKVLAGGAARTARARARGGGVASVAAVAAGGGGDRGVGGQGRECECCEGRHAQERGG